MSAQTRNADLDALKRSNRAFYDAACFLILLAALLALYAIGFVRTEQTHRTIIAERTV